MNTQDLSRRKNIEDSLEWIRQVYLGMRTPLDELLLDGNRFLDRKCVDVAEELASNVGCEASDRTMYRSLFIVILSYLYAACNEEDRIALSVVKIAETFAEQAPCRFDETVFAEMIRCVPVHEYGNMEKAAFALLKAELFCLKAGFDYKVVPSTIAAVITSALQDFLDANRMSCVKNEEKYRLADKELRIAQAGAARIMETR